MTTYDAILPAGGEIDASFGAKVGTRNKALIEFEGQTILARTLNALKSSGRIRRTVVIGPREVHESAAAAQADKLLLPGSSGPDNILKGLAALLESSEPPSKVVVVTTDLPFLTAEIIERFIDSCPTDADICVPLVSKESYQKTFPDSDSTFIPLKDGTWTAGCMYLMDVAALQKAKPHIDKLFEVRKSKIGMAKLLGPKFLFKFLRKTLTIPEVEDKIRQLLHCSGRAISDSSPELAYDIDYLDDYEYALSHLRK